MSKSKKELAAEAFAKYQDAKKVYVADDGNVFLNKNAADLHANTNKGKKKLKVDVFVRTGGESKKETTSKAAKPSVEDRVKSINELTTVEAVDKALSGETAKTVKAAGKAKIKALNAASADKAAKASKGNNGSDAPEKRGEDKK